MKRTYIIFVFLLFAYSCSCQTPDAYSQKILDSIKIEVELLKVSNEKLYAEKTSLNHEVNQIGFEFDSLLLISNINKRKADSLNGLLNLYGVSMLADTIVYELDTAYFVIGDSSVNIIVNKQGEYLKLTLFDNLKNRIYFTKRNEDFDYWFQKDKIDNSSYTFWSGHINLKE